MDLYFADAFKVKASALDRHGAFNISLVADLPLFVDPFLIFNSRRPRYRKLHKEIVKYLRFLHSKARTTALTPGLIASWYRFPEIKENWLGFSQTGNDGRGLGPKFATALHSNLGVLFHGLADARITKGVHLEKLCLVSDRVGRDNISDFTTNLIHRFLCEYTSEFAKRYIDKSLRRRISVSKVRFNYTTETWQSGIFEIPIWKGEHVLLTPKDLLTKDDTWINKTDLYEDFDRIPDSIANDQLRQQIHNYFTKLLPKPKKKRQVKKEERLRAIVDTLRQFPELIDYYIKNKEERGSEAAAQLTPFLTVLFKAVESSPGVALVFTLAIGKSNRATDAYGEENEYVAHKLAEAESVAARKATLLDPPRNGKRCRCSGAAFFRASITRELRKWPTRTVTFGAETRATCRPRRSTRIVPRTY